MYVYILDVLLLCYSIILALVFENNKAVIFKSSMSSLWSCLWSIRFNIQKTTGQNSSTNLPVTDSIKMSFKGCKYMHHLFLCSISSVKGTWHVYICCGFNSLTCLIRIKPITAKGKVHVSWVSFSGCLSEIAKYWSCKIKKACLKHLSYVGVFSFAVSLFSTSN